MHSLSAGQEMTVVVVVVLWWARDWKAVKSMYLPPFLPLEYNDKRGVCVSALADRRLSSFECNHIAVSQM